MSFYYFTAYLKPKLTMRQSIPYLSLLVFAGIACTQPKETTVVPTADSTASKYAHAPLVKHIYTAGPSAHVFEGEIFITSKPM